MRRLLAVVMIAGGMTVALIGAIVTVTQPAPAPAGPTQQDAAGFLDQLSAAIRAGDSTTLYTSLDPRIIAAYGAPACQQRLRAIKDPSASFRVFGTRGPGVWLYSADGHAFLVSSAFALDVDRTTNGMTTRTTTHVAYDSGRWRWFTTC